MANINTMFKVKNAGDQEVVVRFPKGIEIGEFIDAASLLKGMMAIALCEEADVIGQADAPLPCCGDGNASCCVKL